MAIVVDVLGDRHPHAAAGTVGRRGGLGDGDEVDAVGVVEGCDATQRIGDLRQLEKACRVVRVAVELCRAVIEHASDRRRLIVSPAVGAVRLSRHCVPDSVLQRLFRALQRHALDGAARGHVREMRQTRLGVVAAAGRRAGGNDVGVLVPMEAVAKLQIAVVESERHAGGHGGCGIAGRDRCRFEPFLALGKAHRIGGLRRSAVVPPCPARCRRRSSCRRASSSS